MQEIWKEISSYPEFEVSTTGLVRNITTKKD